MYNLEVKFMSLVSILATISFGTVISLIPTLLMITFWVPKIYYEQVKKHYGGNWWAYFKNWPTMFCKDVSRPNGKKRKSFNEYWDTLPDFWKLFWGFTIALGVLLIISYIFF